MADPTSTHGLIGRKTDVPRVRTGSVRRDALILRLEASTAKRVVSVSAPAGYGKTTLLAQWAADEGRPFAWVSLDERDNDPILLLRYVLASLERAGIPPAPDAHTAPHRVQRWARLLPDVAAALVGTSPSPVLVLDDVHVLAGEALDVVTALARLVPDGGQLVLGGRKEVTPVVAHLRVAGDVLELRSDDLALTERETGAVLEAAGTGVEGDAVTQLHRQTEGWPAGLYLAVLALDATGALPSTGSSLDRFVDDYFRSEHLQHLPTDERSFLAHSAVLDRMSADLCDAVLARSGSRRMLETIERSNLFVVALDHERHWFRYHELFRQALLAELDRSNPGVAPELLGRAADWCEAHSLQEDAMAYAIAARDTDRMARLLTTSALPLYRAGRLATVMAWLEHFDDGRLLPRYPTVAAIGGLAHALGGRPFQAERYVDAGWAADPGDPLPDGSTSARAWLATAEAMLCRHGPERMARHAVDALAELGPFSPMRAPASWLHANALLLQGDRSADDALERAVALADDTGGVLVQVAGRAQQANVALRSDDVDRARAQLDQAYRCVAHGRFDDYTPMGLLFATDARVAAGEDDRERAGDRLTGVQRLRPDLTHAVPFLGVQVLVTAANAYLDLGDATGARSLLADARAILRLRPQLGVLVDDVAELTARVKATDQGDGTAASSLTPAELRLLPLLTTHLTFGEIGERLFVSPNTVKTQAISIYRKLDASSRGEAVARAAELGLVDAVSSPPRIIPTG